jgi:hypothetical protein
MEPMWLIRTDGHLWEIAWNPGFPLDAAGNLVILE